MKKYVVEIQSDPVRGDYRTPRGWDRLYADRAEAKECALRAEELWESARVAEIDVPPHVDHLYRNLADRTDASYLYG